MLHGIFPNHGSLFCAPFTGSVFRGLSAPSIHQTRVFSGPAVKGEVTIPHWIAPSPRFRAGDHGEEVLSARHALDVS